MIKLKYIIYIFLGILQGFTEPLPISSSGHLFLFKNLFNIDNALLNDLNFEIFVNFGSFLAILFIFLPDIIKLVKDFFMFIFNKKKRSETKNGFKYSLLILVGSIPVGIMGLLFKEKIENALNIKLLGVAFLITAISLFLVKNSKGTKEDVDITFKDAIIIGILQMVALCPGISRSGIILVGCLLCKLKHETALKYTFMLYFPVSIASMFLGVLDFLKSPVSSSMMLPYILGMIFAGLVTYLSYKWLSNIVKKGKLWKFSIYCLCLAIFIFIYFR